LNPQPFAGVPSFDLSVSFLDFLGDNHRGEFSKLCLSMRLFQKAAVRFVHSGSPKTTQKIANQRQIRQNSYPILEKQ
jgi:hypothetical protein